MSYKLATPKRRVTYYTGKLETLITRFKAEGLESVKFPEADGELSHVSARSSLQRLEEGVGAIETTTSKIEEKLKDYAEEMDNLVEPSPKDIEDFEGYSSRAENAISMAFDYTLQLRARIQVFHSYDRRCSCSGQFSDQNTQHLIRENGEAELSSPKLYTNELHEDSQVFPYNFWLRVKYTDDNIRSNVNIFQQSQQKVTLPLPALIGRPESSQVFHLAYSSQLAKFTHAMVSQLECYK
ncbi:hypothetical protein OSTOST_17496 [Ostertagia ostertagi]